MVLIGRIDTAIVITDVGQRLLDRPEFQNIIKIAPPVYIAYVYTYLHKKHKSFVPILAETLKQMEKENLQQGAIYS